MKHINTDEAKNIIVYIKPPLIDYLIEYYTENIQKETFKLINNLNKSLKYLISVEEKKQFIENEIKINLESEHLELFKRLKFSINNNEIIIDRNWLLDVLEEYPNIGINLTFLSNPKIAYGDHYHYIEISDENQLYEDLQNAMPDLINKISSFIYVDFLITNNMITDDKQVVEADDSKKIKLNIPFKIALLDELGVIKNLKNYVSDEAKYKVIHAIVGGNYDNVKDYCKSLKGEKSALTITQNNKDKAKEFINSKKL